jgi:hypothetical protein
MPMHKNAHKPFSAEAFLFNADLALFQQTSIRLKRNYIATIGRQPTNIFTVCSQC